MPSSDLTPGSVVWATLDPVRGREQSGHRPALVVASARYLETVTSLTIVVPITSVDRGWINHVRLDGEHGLDRASWAMTEQPRTLARDRLTSIAGRANNRCLAEIRMWLADFLELQP